MRWGRYEESLWRIGNGHDSCSVFGFGGWRRSALHCSRKSPDPMKKAAERERRRHSAVSRCGDLVVFATDCPSPSHWRLWPATAVRNLCCPAAWMLTW